MARLFCEVKYGDPPTNAMLDMRCRIMDKAAAGHSLSDRAVVLLGMAIEAAYDAGFKAANNEEDE